MFATMTRYRYTRYPIPAVIIPLSLYTLNKAQEKLICLIQSMLGKLGIAQMWQFDQT